MRITYAGTATAEEPEPVVEIKMGVNRVDDQWFVFFKGGGHDETVGPFDTEADAMLVFERLKTMSIEKGGYILPDGARLQ